MESDEDLNFIRTSPLYKTLTERIQKESNSAPKESDALSPFSNELALLDSMGFSDREKNRLLLIQTNGQVETTIALLLTTTQN